MKKLIQILMVTLLSALVFSGCAIKNDDGILTKGVKHTINSPLYAGMAIAVAPVIAMAGVKAVADKVTSSEPTSSENQLENKVQ